MVLLDDLEVDVQHSKRPFEEQERCFILGLVLFKTAKLRFFVKLTILSFGIVAEKMYLCKIKLKGENIFCLDIYL